MADEKTQLQKLIRPGTKPIGIHARLSQAKGIDSFTNPQTQENRIGIVFDDSISMSGDAIDQAHKAVSAFLRSCNPSKEAIAVYPMNKLCRPLITQFALIDMYVQGIQASGGTPLYGTIINCIKSEPINRVIVFSDGAPGDHREQETVELCKSKDIKCDTVYIGPKRTDSGAKLLERLAELTGGLFLHFTDPSIFAQNMRYLAPSFRAMLANPEVKAKIEKGEKL